VVGARAAPQLLAYPYYAHAVLPAASVVATGGSVPVAIGGYKAVAGEGGAVHEVPGLLPAPALAKQESAGGVSLSTGMQLTNLCAESSVLVAPKCTIQSWPSNLLIR
jgi:hypothetical protein